MLFPTISGPLNLILIQFSSIKLQDIFKKFILTILKRTTERGEADFMLQDTGEKKWYKRAFANKYHAEDQPPWTSPL